MWYFLAERHSPKDEYENILPPIEKQSPSAYQSNQEPNIEFHKSEAVCEKQGIMKKHT